MNKHCNLLQRSKQICNSKGIMLLKYLFYKSYALKYKLLFKDDSSDCIADSIATLFCIYDNPNSQYLTRFVAKTILLSYFLPDAQN